MPDKGYRDSFRQLGYELSSVRQDWSSENDTGVCLSLWSKEMQSERGIPTADSKRDFEPMETWEHKVGHKRRHEHLKSAWNNHDRWVDMVIRQGGPHDDNVSSNPWIVADRKSYKWRLQSFDEETGHFSAKPEPFSD